MDDTAYTQLKRSLAKLLDLDLDGYKQPQMRRRIETFVTKHGNAPVAFIERLQKGSGGFGVIMELAHNWADWEQTKRHYELMARYVHPHFQRQSNSLRVASYDNATAKHATAGAESAQAVQAEIDRYSQAKEKAAGKAAS